MSQDSAEGCPNESLLLGYALRQLEEAERNEVDEHLSRCRMCREVVVLWASRSKDAHGGPDSSIEAWSANPTANRLEEGDTLGRFEILGRLGTGAFGTVYEARDPRIERRVALKFVPGSPDDTSRLLHEGQALGRLNHPNVVTVHEVGRVPGGGAVIMELVEGQTLAQWASSPAVSARDVAAMFVQLGRGLAAVHEAGLVHRDIKPQNILIGADGQARIVDFGLATAASPRGTDIALTQLVGATTLAQAEHSGWGGAGTPAYMAPERLAGGDATERSDQFSVCVSLFEAIHGIRPFTGSTLEELQTAMQRGRVALIDGRRRGPGWLARIAHRGLAFAPADRFDSMTALADALQRGLGRRRRYAVAVAGSTTAALVAWAWQTAGADRPLPCTGAQTHLVGIWDDARRSEVREAILGVGVPYAEGVWLQTARELDVYAAAWISMHTETCEATTVHGEQSPEVMDLRMACLHRSRMNLAATTDVLARADEGVVEHADQLVGELRPLSRCADVDALQLEVAAPPPEDAAAVQEVRALLAEAAAERLGGRYQDANAKLQDLKPRLEAVAYRPLQAEVGLEEGLILRYLGQYEAAEAALRRTLELASELRQIEPIQLAAKELMFTVGHDQGRVEEALQYRELAQGLAAGDPFRSAGVRSVVAMLFSAQGDAEAAAAEHRRAIALYDSVRPGHSNIARSRHGLALALEKQGKFDEAEVEHREALELLERTEGPTHPEVAVLLNDLANALDAQGKYRQGEPMHRRALASVEDALGPDHPHVVVLLNDLAVCLRALGRLEEAEASARRAVKLAETSWGPEHAAVVVSLNNLALILFSRGAYAESESNSRQALRISEKTGRTSHPDTAAARQNLAIALNLQGRVAEAETELRLAAALMEELFGVEHPRIAGVRNDLAGALVAQGKLGAAEAELRQAIAIETKVHGEQLPAVATMMGNLAEVLLDQGKHEEALRWASSTWESRRRLGAPPAKRASSAFLLAQALWAQPQQSLRADRSRAVELAQTASDAYAEGGEAYADARADVEAWLRQHR